MIVTHHGVLKILMGIIENTPKEEWMNYTFKYGEVRLIDSLLPEKNNMG